MKQAFFKNVYVSRLKWLIIPPDIDTYMVL